MSELERLLPRIAPPPGGEVRLRSALRETSNARLALRWAPGAALAASLALVLAFVPRVTPQEREVARVLREALAPRPPQPVMEGGTARELPSADPAVRIYLVTSVTPNS